MRAVIAIYPGKDRVITGLTLAERARRVAVQAGIPADRVHLVRSADELSRLDLAGEPLLFLRADGWVVAAPLLEPLRLADEGTRVAVDADGAYAGALRADGARATEVLAALRADWDGGDAAAQAGWSDAARVTVSRRARHPARTREEVRAADAWQFELVNKPLDGFLTVWFYRPVARPLTRLFLRSPFSPNAISVLSATLSLVGCVVAMGASWHRHVIGLALLCVGGIVDCNDGEVARLRLEGSRLGAWLDAIGDDVARVALLLAIGVHVAKLHPGWPVPLLTGGALFMTLVAMALIYWYCIFVIRSTNNQDYGAVLGIGPGQGAEKQRRSLVRTLGDAGAIIARRDFMDLAVLALALVNKPEASFFGLAVGAVIGLIVVVPAHLRIVRSRRLA